MQLKYLLLILLLLCLVGCRKEEDVFVRKDLPQLHVEEIINLAKREAVYRHQIDWDDFERQVKSKAADAKTIEETYPAVELALTLLQEKHSSYFSRDGVVVHNPISGCYLTYPVAVPEDEEIGYLKIDAFSGADHGLVMQYVNVAHEAIRVADERKLKGWIVDLRGNNGGNMWPMLLSIGPVLGNGVAGYFIDAYGELKSWSYDNGHASTRSLSGKEMGYRIFLEQYYMLKNPNPKVAVLVDRTVASSGELIFISFKERPNTRSFGSPSCGSSTELKAYNLSNGAQLNLARSVFADRTQTKYGSVVNPDEILSDEEAVKRAIEWIKE